jgi:SAM-dependent methyltransferase
VTTSSACPRRRSNVTPYDHRQHPALRHAVLHGQGPAVRRDREGRRLAGRSLRFKQFDHLWGREREFSLNDIGCGYGALYGYLTKRKFRVTYCGVDLAAAMLDEGRRLYGESAAVTWHQGSTAPRKLDYTVASGILNVKGETSFEDWKPYVFENIDVMAAASNRGFAFNVLSTHSDRHLWPPHLYFADPGEIVDYVGSKFSRNLVLLQNYRLYEFTLCCRF